jgi:anaerobic ribonucleoside-triphosphate reductase
MAATKINHVDISGGLMSNDDVLSYLSLGDWEVQENSNQNFSLQNLNTYLSTKAIKKFWLEEVYNEEIRKAVKDNRIHIHDLGLLATYCVGWDLQDLLMVGFKGVENKVQSKPAKHFRSILGQLVNFFYTLQGEAAGAQAISNFDTLLAPFIAYDNLSYKEVKQALQEFLFNMNVPTRVGFQTPFTNITMDLEVPKMFKDSPVVIGGEYQDVTYSEFQKEMDDLNAAFAEVMMEGDAKGRVFAFPIPTYNITKDFNWDNPNLEGLWRMTGKYGIPYFSNFVNSDMDPEDARSMCCRLRLDNRELRKRGGGLFGSNPLTGSLGVVTINLPQLGYLAHNKRDFLNLLDYFVGLSASSLMIKRKVIEEYTEKDLYPYSKFYLRGVKEKTGQYWKNHFNTIGILGMNEACLNFLNKDIGSEEGKEFAESVLNHIRDCLSELQKVTGELFNLEATPGESTAYRFAKADKEAYSDIVCANEDDFKNESAKPYYTNSTHLPVNYTDDMFEALDLQDELQSLYTGGTVQHLFLGEEVPDIDTVKAIVKKVSSNYKLPYFTITPTFSVCPNHGYLPGKKERCDDCGAETEVYSRVVGYLRPVKCWNEGKQEEFKNRKVYKGV